MKLKVLITAALLTILQGCAFLDRLRENDNIVIPPEKVIHVDPRVLETCKPLPTLDNTEPISILRNLEGIILVYKDCSGKQDNSIKIIKELSNVKP